MYALDTQTARPYGRRRRGHQHGHMLLTPAVEAHTKAESGHPEMQRFECARNPQGGTVTIATAKQFYTRGSAQCGACCHNRDCSGKQ